MAAVELLAPAPSVEALDAAIGEGADAVYLSIKDAKAPARSPGFSYSRFEGALSVLHRMGRKLYVALDTVFEQREADRIFQLLKYLAGCGPDAVIVQDLGIISMARENFPQLKLHASPNMNVASARGANLLSRHGFSRTVLARELSLDEIRSIRANTNLELEVFVHGALCVSVSGICLFSSYLGGKSANRGICTQACRRSYTAYKGKGFDAGPADGEGGGYYFSPADLELIEMLPLLAQAGINAFRIEGRMKSAEYVGTVVSAYRLVLDSMYAAYQEGAGEDELKHAFKEARSILKNDFARPKTRYLINGAGTSGGKGNDGAPVIDWLNPEQDGGIGIPLGTLLRVKGREDESRGLLPAGLFALSPGDSVRLHKADETERVSYKLSFVEKGPGGGSWISIPEGFGQGDAVYLIQTKNMTRRYKPVIAREGSGISPGRTPGRDKAPPPSVFLAAAAKDLAHNKILSGSRMLVNKKDTGSKSGKGRRRAPEDFPPGYYAMVSRIEDLYVLQSSKPEKAILPLSRKCAKQLLNSGVLPFPACDIILSLDPFFPQGDETELENQIGALIEKGYSRFILNNLGHFSLFRRKDDEEQAVLIAGPWLYTFNAWAWDFISGSGASYCVSPLENNRQNLERTFPNENYLRSKVFITIFSKPALFRIRQDLRKVYDFENFTGSREEAFRMAHTEEGTNVYPWEAFSIVDKTPFLREAGFSRFVLDFSSGPLKKTEYRDIMEAVKLSAPVRGVNRFNWKNGFYREAPAK